MSLEVPAAEKPKVDVDHMAKLLFLSFKFSQGDGGLQQQIFDYFIMKGQIPSLSQDMRKQIASRAQSMAKRYFMGNQKHTTEGGTEEKPVPLESEIEKEMLKQIGLLGSVPPERGRTLKGFLGIIAENIIAQDYKYLIQEKGRPNRAKSETSSYEPTLDPYLSHICYYGILEKNTGLEEFDDLFGQIRNVVQKDPLGGEARWKLDAVMKDWNARHPDQQVAIPA